MSTNDTFLAVFLGSKTSPKWAAWNALVPKRPHRLRFRRPKRGRSFGPSHRVRVSRVPVRHLVNRKHGQPRNIELRGRCRRPSTRHAIGLHHTRNRPACVKRRTARGEQVRCLDTAARPMSQREQAGGRSARPVHDERRCTNRCRDGCGLSGRFRLSPDS